MTTPPSQVFVVPASEMNSQLFFGLLPVDGAKKATDDSTDKLIMNCILPLCWSLGGNKQRCENESCYQVDSPLKQKKKESHSAVSISGYSSDAVPSLCSDKETDSGAPERG